MKRKRKVTNNKWLQPTCPLATSNTVKQRLLINTTKETHNPTINQQRANYAQTPNSRKEAFEKPSIRFMNHSSVEL